MVLHGRFYVLDEIHIYREEVRHIAPICHTRDFHCNSERYITTFPVAHLEHLMYRTTTAYINLTGEVVACTVLRSVTGHEAPSTQITAVVDSDVAAGLHN